MYSSGLRFRYLCDVFVFLFGIEVFFFFNFRNWQGNICKIYIFAFRFRDVAQSGSVHAWGACGRWFESSHPDLTFSSKIKTLLIL